MALKTVRRSRPILGSWGPQLQPFRVVDVWARPVRPEQTTDPTAWANAVFHPMNMPRVVQTLLRARDTMARPFKLRTGSVSEPPATGFPQLDSSNNALLLGMDDRHLDFRVVLHVGQARVTVTTLVRINNWFGHCYWAVVRFFHPFITRSCLRRATPKT